MYKYISWSICHPKDIQVNAFAHLGFVDQAYDVFVIYPIAQVRQQKETKNVWLAMQEIYYFVHQAVALAVLCRLISFLLPSLCKSFCCSNGILTMILRRPYQIACVSFYPGNADFLIFRIFRTSRQYFHFYRKIWIMQ